MPVEPAAVEPGRVYLDYAGFAPVDPRVLAVMRPFLEAGIGNPSARHSLGAEARESLDAARVKVARLCGGAAGGIVFTSGATEANNLAIKGVVARARGGGSARVLRLGDRAHLGDQRLPRPGEGGRDGVPPAGGRRGPGGSRRAAGGPHGRTPRSSRSPPPTPRSAPCSRSRRSGGSPARRACRCTWTGSGALGRVPLNVEAMSIDLLDHLGERSLRPAGQRRPLGPARRADPSADAGRRPGGWLPLRHGERARRGRPRGGRRADARGGRPPGGRPARGPARPAACTGCSRRSPTAG